MSWQLSFSSLKKTLAGSPLDPSGTKIPRDQGRNLRKTRRENLCPETKIRIAKEVEFEVVFVKNVV
jgi:hypothetical protein